MHAWKQEARSVSQGARRKRSRGSRACVAASSFRKWREEGFGTDSEGDSVSRSSQPTTGTKARTAHVLSLYFPGSGPD
jgi:hypothetical protein